MTFTILDTNLSNNSQSLDLTVSFEDKTFHIFFESTGAGLHVNPEALIAGLLLPAMKNKAGAIHIEDQPDPTFLQNLVKIQTLYQSWKPGYQPVEIHSRKSYKPSKQKGSRTGIFFSCGVDSSYALLEHLDQVTDLIFIHGFDIPLKSEALLEKRSQSIHKIAASLGKGVVEVKTNLRNFMEPGVFWGLAHGAALASVGHVLSGEFSRIFIPPSYSSQAMRAWGSHPHLDPLWSNEVIEFIHNEEELTRPFRVAKIVHNQTILDNLHVCLHNNPSGLNCGKCEKCVRTMISLRALGVLDKCHTFERPLTNWSILSTYLFRSTIRLYVEFNLDLAKETGLDPELIRILQFVLKAPTLPSIRKITHKLGRKKLGKIARNF